MTNGGIQLGFGGGCHWCTEAVYSALVGISRVQQGFIKSYPPNEEYSEAVLIQYKEEEISLSTLIEIHLCTHASSSSHSMRKKYRSAIYVDSDDMKSRCRETLNTLQYKFDNPLITQVLDIVHFKHSSEIYSHYYTTNPNRPFCVTYIEPKLDRLRREFSAYLKP